jgi:hypothetical protein
MTENERPDMVAQSPSIFILKPMTRLIREETEKRKGMTLTL